MTLPLRTLTAVLHRAPADLSERTADLRAEVAADLAGVDPHRVLGLLELLVEHGFVRADVWRRLVLHVAATVPPPEKWANDITRLNYNCMRSAAASVAHFRGVATVGAVDNLHGYTRKALAAPWLVDEMLAGLADLSALVLRGSPS